ncbi:MAG: copper chaperone PCu(A)C [Acidimicrobiia bacterium]|nr:copper chaperone PCu(A)C [Acidimicrobiia bacterium]
MRRLVLILAVLGVIATGCGGGDDISIDGEWARNSPMRADRGAVYMNIESSDGDRLLSASVDPSISASVEVHETVPAQGETNEDGMAMMVMQEVQAIELPAGETVVLEPGGLHIMLIDIAAPLEIGEKFDLTLDFETAGEMVLEVEVREEAP